MNLLHVQRHLQRARYHADLRHGHKPHAQKEVLAAEQPHFEQGLIHGELLAHERHQQQERA